LLSRFDIDLAVSAAEFLNRNLAFRLVTDIHNCEIFADRNYGPTKNFALFRFFLREAFSKHCGEVVFAFHHRFRHTHGKKSAP